MAKPTKFSPSFAPAHFGQTRNTAALSWFRCAGPARTAVRIVEAALSGLHCIYKPDFLYAKAGGMLLGLQPASVHQTELNLEPDDVREKVWLMGALWTALTAGMDGARCYWVARGCKATSDEGR